MQSLRVIITHSDVLRQLPCAASGRGFSSIETALLPIAGTSGAAALAPQQQQQLQQLANGLQLSPAMLQAAAKAAAVSGGLDQLNCMRSAGPCPAHDMHAAWLHTLIRILSTSRLT